jgi:hypothetical protein
MNVYSALAQSPHPAKFSALLQIERGMDALIPPFAFSPARQAQAHRLFVV